MEKRMQELVQRLNDAAYAYYQTDQEIMSNFEYDTLYDELQQLEEKSGVVLSGSPTQRVGYEVVSSLPKVVHALPMKFRFPWCFPLLFLLLLTGAGGQFAPVTLRRGSLVVTGYNMPCTFFYA